MKRRRRTTVINPLPGLLLLLLLLFAQIYVIKFCWQNKKWFIKLSRVFWTIVSFVSSWANLIKEWDLPMNLADINAWKLRLRCHGLSSAGMSEVSLDEKLLGSTNQRKRNWELQRKEKLILWLLSLKQLKADLPVTQSLGAWSRNTYWKITTWLVDLRLTTNSFPKISQ